MQSQNNRLHVSIGTAIELLRTIDSDESAAVHAPTKSGGRGGVLICCLP